MCWREREKLIIDPLSPTRKDSKGDWKCVCVCVCLWVWARKREQGQLNPDTREQVGSRSSSKNAAEWGASHMCVIPHMSHQWWSLSTLVYKGKSVLVHLLIITSSLLFFHFFFLHTHTHTHTQHDWILSTDSTATSFFFDVIFSFWYETSTATTTSCPSTSQHKRTWPSACEYLSCNVCTLLSC